VKTVKVHGAKASGEQTERLSVRVSAEAYERLFVASVMSRATASEILDRLILAHCREWSLPGKISARAATHDRVAPTPELNLDAPALPSQVAA
jgi:hypothetical protein